MVNISNKKIKKSQRAVVVKKVIVSNIVNNGKTIMEIKLKKLLKRSQ